MVLIFGRVIKKSAIDKGNKMANTGTNSNIGNWVAIVSVIMTAATAIYSTWDKSRMEIRLAEVKASYEIQKDEASRSWNERKERCNLIIDAARKLAQSQGKSIVN